MLTTLTRGKVKGCHGHVYNEVEQNDPHVHARAMLLAVLRCTMRLARMTTSSVTDTFVLFTATGKDRVGTHEPRCCARCLHLAACCSLNFRSQERRIGKECVSKCRSR